MALPAMLLAIPGGHLADRFDRRWVLASMLLLTLLDSSRAGHGLRVALCRPCGFICC